jgi:hypothetical protein
VVVREEDEAVPDAGTAMTDHLMRIWKTLTPAANSESGTGACATLRECRRLRNFCCL